MSLTLFPITLREANAFVRPLGADAVNEIRIGDCRDVMRDLIAEGLKAQMCVTSPPYWGLRDYGVEGQLGLEPTIEEYVSNMVEVFRLVRDLLAADATLWLNLGDSYSGSGRGGHVSNSSTLDGSIEHEQECRKARGSQLVAGLHHDVLASGAIGRAWVPPPSGLKPKNLCGIPWRVAFALQADGWYLRQDIIWHKPNPMPESVRDRCTKAHEYLFLLSKSQRYHYDADAIAEPATKDERRPTFRGGASVNNSTFLNGEGGKSTVIGNVKVKVPSGWDTKPGAHGTVHREGRTTIPEYSNRKDSVSHVGNGVQSGFASNTSHHQPYGTRNRRSVWTIASQPYSEAHFATFPEALVEPCILAGSRPDDIVLDPFMGSGTVARVAQRLGRRWAGIELNPEYGKLAAERAVVTTGLPLEIGWRSAAFRNAVADWDEEERGKT